MSSNNESGVVNQQERLDVILESSETICDLIIQNEGYAEMLSDIYVTRECWPP